MPYRKTAYTVMMVGFVEAMVCRLIFPFNKFWISCIGYALILLVFIYISIWMFRIKRTREGIILLIIAIMLATGSGFAIAMFL